jgi:hypothetical protein
MASLPIKIMIIIDYWDPQIFRDEDQGQAVRNIPWVGTYVDDIK